MTCGACKEKKSLAARGLCNRCYLSLRRVFALQVLGGHCEHCGSGALDVLQFDHVRPLRRRLGVESEDTNAVIRRVLAGDSSNLRLLCANCHHRHSWSTVGLVERWLLQQPEQQHKGSARSRRP